VLLLRRSVTVVLVLDSSEAHIVPASNNVRLGAIGCERSVFARRVLPDRGQQPRLQRAPLRAQDDCNARVGQKSIAG